MKLAIDISQTTYEGTGSARYTIGAINSILKWNKNNAWTFFFSGLRRSVSPNLKKIIEEHQGVLKTAHFSPNMLHYLWNILHIVTIDTFIGKNDWLITSDWTQPPSRSKIATVVHDLAFLRYPDNVAKKSIQAQSKRLEWAKKEATLFLSSSHSTKQDLIDFLHIPADKIAVIYPGVDVFEPDSNQLMNIQKKYHITKPFILTVGKIEPRKNLKILIQAFQLLSNKNIDLFIVGQQGWEQEKHPNQSDIRFLGYIPDEDLFALYKLSLFFVFPSLWEGFGYPAIEAMKMGCPVTMSNTSSLGEIGKNSALLFNPSNIKEITTSLQRMIEDDELRKKMAKNGTEYCKQFTWENYYSNLMNVLAGN